MKKTRIVPRGASMSRMFAAAQKAKNVLRAQGIGVSIHLNGSHSSMRPRIQKEIPVTQHTPILKTRIPAQVDVPEQYHATYSARPVVGGESNGLYANPALPRGGNQRESFRGAPRERADVTLKSKRK